jgi:hypothetical protein
MALGCYEWSSGDSCLDRHCAVEAMKVIPLTLEDANKFVKQVMGYEKVITYTVTQIYYLVMLS